MKKVFSFCNQKGGVGKTTTTINIAAALALNGFKTLVMDMDAQANATSGLGEQKPSLEFTTYQLLVDNADPMTLVKQTQIPNLHLIPSCADLSGVELELIQEERREYRLSEKMQVLRDEFDFILIDCPPSLGLITLNCLVASNCLIIPLQCEYYALEGLGQLLNTFQLVQRNLNQSLEIGGVLLTMADLRTNLAQQVAAEVREYFKEKVFTEVIPRSVKVSEAPSFGKPAIIYDLHNKGTKSYLSVSSQFAEWYGGRKLSEEVVKTFFHQSASNQAQSSEVPKENVEENEPAEDQPVTENSQGGQL